MDSFYNSENVDNLNEKNESKQRNGTMNSTPEGMIQIHNINNTTNNPHEIKTNIQQIGNVGNNQEYFYRYMNFLLLELQGENIRTGINNIFLSDTSGASLENNIAGN